LITPKIQSIMKKSLHMIAFTTAIIFSTIFNLSGQTTVLSENFSGFTLANGSTDLSSTLDTKMQTVGWTGSKVYENNGNAKLGSSSAAGYLITPAVNLSGNGGAATLKLDLMKYSSDAAVVQVLYASNGTTFAQVGSTVTPTSTVTTYTFNITGGTTTGKIKIVGTVTSSGRFYVDNIILTQTATSVTAPTVTTTSASGITSSSASSGGNVTADGGATVTARGVCWATTVNPTVSNNISSDGTGIGTFTSSITGLSASTLYYVRAYATNSAGTSYGTQISFTTSSATTTSVPTVTTTAASSITNTTASSGGNVTADGGATVTARGVCWSTTTNPTTSNSKTTDGTGTGTFTSSITGLSASTTYHVRAYAVNSVGTAYGSDLSFTTTGSGSNTGTVTVSVTSLYDFRNVYANMMSDGQFFTVSGTGLSGNITVTAPTGFSVSSVYKSGYCNSISLSQSGGTLASTKVYVRLTPTATGAYSGNINITGASAAKTVSVSGTCVASYIPSGYYSNATGTGAALKTKLYNIISSHTVRSYDNLWTDFQTTDKAFDGKVWDMYSSQFENAPAYEFTFGTGQCGSYSAEGDCYNREHSFPKSWWGGATQTQYTDLFHLVPTDGSVNNMRSNYAFGTVASPTYTSSNGSKLGPCSYPGYTGVVFEPIDEFKGDFARNYFYLATCYENVIAGWQTNDTNGDAMLNGTSFPVFETWALNLLRAWNAADPVSQKEIERNQSVYGIQGNRNPFIDHPEYVEMIWGSGTASVPTVTTNSASAITSTSATGGGNITADGGASVTARGVCWATTANPTTSSSKTSDGTGTGTFTSSITGLSASTLYYVRAYALNSVGTSYGTQVSFTTLAATTTTAPTVTTNTVSSITSAAATCGGNVTADGGASVTARGVCWSTTANPTISNSKTSDGTGTGTYTSSISGLAASTLYYLRAYAVNSVGTSYGAQQTFTTTAVSGPTCTTTSNISVAASAWVYYTVAVPSGATNLVIGISGGTGDADLYTQFGANPTTSSYLCRPYVSGNTETCTVAAPSVGTYYIGIRGYSASAGITLSICYTAAAKSGTFEIKYIGSSVDKGNTFEIYPNPANDFITVLIPGIPQDAFIYDINGRIVKTVSLNHTQQIDIRDLPSGIYMLRVSDEGKLISKRFIKK
jgi:endonuclease I